MPFCLHPPSPCHITPSAAFLRLPPALRVHAFSTSAGLLAAASEPTLYEILDVPATATTQEIKKQFYSLSLSHHPDKNPDDPTAHSKFAAISSAYQVLGDTTKRARYDRDNGIHQTPTAPGSSGPRGANARRGSYVGSRPPSGLSKQRGPFRGPPPSFYAHGGFRGETAHGGGSSNNQTHNQHNQHNQQFWQHEPHRHRQQHQQQSSHGPFASSSSSSSASWARSSSSSSSTADDDPTSFIHRNPIHHFDASAHFRTQAQEDVRRRIRRVRAVEHAKRQARAHGLEVDEEPGSTAARFFAIMGLVVVATVSMNLDRVLEVPLGRRPGDGSGGGGGGAEGADTRARGVHQQ